MVVRRVEYQILLGAQQSFRLVLIPPDEDAEVRAQQQRFQETDQSETSSLFSPCLWSGAAHRRPAPGRGGSAARPSDWLRAPSVVGLSSSGWVGVGLQRWSERVCREAVCLKPPREQTAFTRSWFCVLPPVRSTMTRSRGTQRRFTWTSVSSEPSSNSHSDFCSFHFIGCGVGPLVLVLVLVLLDCGFCQLESTSQVVWAGSPVGTSPPCLHAVIGFSIISSSSSSSSGSPPPPPPPPPPPLGPPSLLWGASFLPGRPGR